MMIELPYRALFFDTSFLIALMYLKDEEHRKSEQFFYSVLETDISLYTTIDVISETITTLRYLRKIGYHLVKRFIEEIRPHLLVRYPTKDDYQRVQDLYLKYAKDKEISFCDLVSYVIVKERLNNIPCLSFDSDFKQLGLNVLDLSRIL
jgi:predicted nucleic acid-binding protein